MEHMTCCKLWLSFFVYLPIATKEIAIATDNFFCIRIPYYKLFAAIRHSIELVNIQSLSCATTCRTESKFTKTTNLSHHIW